MGRTMQRDTSPIDDCPAATALIKGSLAPTPEQASGFRFKKGSLTPAPQQDRCAMKAGQAQLQVEGTNQQHDSCSSELLS